MRSPAFALFWYDSPHMTIGLATGLVLLVVALVARAASVNRHVRVRLLVSAFALALYVLSDAAAIYGSLSPELRQIVSLQPLLLAFGVINAVVALLLNPWREDRLPDRFPNIVQDSIVIALFAAAATLLLPEKIFATTAVGAVVIGFALQDTLGNLFAGLAIQIEKPFRVGQWVHIAGKDGLVRAITWRATKIRTKAGNFVIVPNSALSRDTITNYSEPTPDTRVELEVGASYDTPPNEVKAVILAAIKDEPLISPDHAPEVLLVDFAASAITYRVRVWTTDFSADEKIRDHIRSAIYYAFRRAAIVIPYPIQVQIEASAATAERAMDATLGSVEIFASLDDAARAELARAARRNLYAAGETIVRQGDSGSSMFIVVRGEAAVIIEPSGQEVARVSPGGFFGEMSLLTGAPRAATVKTRVDSELMEITADTFRQFVLANPAAVEQIGGAVAARAAELDRHRAAGAPAAPVEPPSTFVTRVRRFLGLH
jgi:small-conductance mechanosensitive channel/CRP-like cAMP-binding protein